MSDARDTIFARLESAHSPAAPAPGDMTPPADPTDLLATLCDRVEEAGGLFQSLSRDDWLNQITWPMELSAMHHIYSTIAALEPRGVGRTAATDHELDPLDICVLRADFAVAENGAVWHVPSRPRERSAALLAQHLILFVDETEVVPTLHQAYDRIDLAETRFGWFLCGPSKTADIEQSLVLGAHGPRTMSLVVTHD